MMCCRIARDLFCVPLHAVTESTPPNKEDGNNGRVERQTEPKEAKQRREEDVRLIEHGSATADSLFL